MDFRCVIIDDEQYAIDALAGYIDKMPQLQLFKGFTDPLKAMAEISSEDKIDFIFTDIEMPGITGIALAKQLRHRCRFLIFTTGHSNYALDAFDVGADQYLLKPITLSRFASVISEVLRNVKQVFREESAQANKLQFIKADQKNAYHFIDEQTIVSVEADRNYVRIYTTLETKPFDVHMGLNQVEEALASNDFIRINKSTMIAKKYIKKIEGSLIKLTDGKSYILGATFKASFSEFLSQHMLKSKPDS